MICPICSNKKTYVLFSQNDKRTTMPGTFDVYRCQKCQTDYIKPPENLSDFYQSDYYADFLANKNLLFRMKQRIICEKYSKTTGFIRKKIFDFLANFISALPKKTGRVLDFGCAFGDILYLLKRAGFDVYGMDISEIAVNKCRNHGLINVSLGIEKNLDQYPDDYFDAIRASHVIEHMIDPKLFVQLAFKKLKLNGELIIQTPNINSMGQLFGRYTKYYYDIPRHITLLSSKSIKLLLHNYGFNKINISYLNFFGDQIDNLYFLLKSKYSVLYKIVNQTSVKLIIRILLTPLEMFLSLIRYSQTITVSAIK